MSGRRKIRVLYVVAMPVRWLAFEWLCQERGGGEDDAGRTGEVIRT
jgi:hypothetical protein